MTSTATVLARVIVDELARCGVRDAVLCPGSRNAPLAFALHDADAAGRIRLHVRTDERTAGFLAVGLTVASGRPVPVAVTSGTAVANLHPAVLEASHAGVPLLAVTADRPAELVGTGASQTVDQRGIFSGAVRWSGSGSGDTSRVRSTVDRAVAAATGAPPGPVHLNVPFDVPLVPDGAPVPDGRTGGGPWTHVAPARREPALLPLDPAARTLVVAGSEIPDGGTLGRSRTGGVPIVAEPSSPLWPLSVRTGPWLAGRGDLRPDQVLVIGRPTLHRDVLGLLADPGIAVYAAAGPSGGPWPDVAGSVRAVGSVPTLTPPEDWVEIWRKADDAAAAALDRELDRAGTPGLRLARALVAAQPDGTQLVLGSSNPVRDVALAAAPRAGLTVRANRGVAGIDGTVSTAVGAALAHPGPTVALLGDLTLLHDTTGLWIGPDEPRPDLTLVVLNDDGGGIFSLLEQGAPEYAGAFERVFGTPTGVDLAALAAAAGIGHTHWDGCVADLVTRPGQGVRIVEVSAGRSGLREAHAALRRTVRHPAT